MLADAKGQLTDLILRKIFVISWKVVVRHSANVTTANWGMRVDC